MRLTEAEKLFSAVPKVKLGFFPTPFHRLDRLSDEYGVNIYMKRDDFTGIGLFGGNKIRKLQYLMADAKKQGAEYVFTYGATQSNHAMQTATACRRCGFKPVLYLLSIVKPDAEPKGNILLDEILGAEIHIVSPSGADIKALAREHMDRLEAEGHRCYEIPGGGANAIGSSAYIEGYAEMTRQAKKLLLRPDYIFHATGTSGTAAGLVAGRKLLNDKTCIISVAAADLGDTGKYAAEAAALSQAALRYIGCNIAVSPSDFSIETSYYGEGYEIPSRAGTEAIKKLALTEGILIDPVYSGKAFAGMLDYIASGRIRRDENVVFWHTGGTTALFAEKAILGEIFNK